MPIPEQVQSKLSNAKTFPVGKVICVIEAVWKVYSAIKAAKGDKTKIEAAATVFVTDIEACLV